MTTTRSSTRRRSARDSCRFLQAAGRQSRSPGLTAPPMDTRTSGHKPSPGGKVLFTIWGQNKGNAVLSLESGQWEMVLPTTTFASALFDVTSPGGAQVGPGRLLLVDAAAGLRAAPFDARRPARTTADALVLDNVYSDTSTESRGWLATSKNGTAVYAFGNPSRTSLVWVDREGKTNPVRDEPDVYQEVCVSPDGTKAVVRQGLNLWVHDFQRGTHSPLTSGLESNVLPAWSRDGRRVLFASNRGGDWDIYSQPADGSGAAAVLLKRPIRSVSVHGLGRWDVGVYRNPAHDRPGSVDGVARWQGVAVARHPIQRTGRRVRPRPGGRAAPGRLRVRRVGAKRDLRAVVPRRRVPSSRSRREAGSDPCGPRTARTSSTWRATT